MAAGRRMLVIGDSLAFHGPEGPLPADHPGLWPNVAAAELGGTTELFAGFGWTARDAWWAVTGDPSLWAELPRTDLIVLAVGSMDTLPSPLPSYLRQGLRYLRPDAVRRWARTRYLAAQPALSRLSGWPVALPPRLTVRYLGDCVRSLRTLYPGMPVVGVLPSVHRAADYGYAHPGRPAAEVALRAWGRSSDVPMLDLAALVGSHVRGGEGNPDGMHWGWAGHAAVGHGLAELVSSGVRSLG